MQGIVYKNAYGHDELRFFDSQGGYVIAIKYNEEAQYVTGNKGQVTSVTHNEIGGVDVIKNAKDIERNIAAIGRIRRLPKEYKDELIKFLKTF